jgi:carboxymethylenebutenolidase
MRLLLLLFIPFAVLGCTAKPDPVGAGVTTEAVAYGTGKNTVTGFLGLPGGPGPFPGLVVVHGDFGLDDGVKEQLRRLAGKGYAVLAVDLYRGEKVQDTLDAHIMDRGLPQDRVLADLKNAVSYLKGRPDVRGDAIGILGWDSGGGYALDAAINDYRLRAAVVCYGRLTTDPTILKPMQASVLGIFAGKDAGITPETIAQFRAAMQKAGKPLAGVYVYPACEHGFLLPSNAQQAAPPADIADAWNQIERYLAEELNKS